MQVHFKEIEDALLSAGVDLVHNRFLILQVIIIVVDKGFEVFIIIIFFIFPVWCLTCNYRMVNCQNKARTTTQFSSRTLNVRGLTSETKRECLGELFDDYNLDVLCLQETKTKNEETIQQKNSTLHLLS